MAIFDTTIFLPYFAAFLFVFAIVFGILESAKVFGNRNVNAAIAIVFGIFSAMYEPFVSGIQEFLPIIVIPLIFVFFYILLKKIQKQYGSEGGGGAKNAFPLTLVIITLMIVLVSQYQRVQGFLPADIDPMTFAWIAGIILVIIVFAAVYRHPDGEGGVGRSAGPTG